MDWRGKIDKSWTLFLDRDGVINVRLIDDYVKNLGEFEFLPGVLDAFTIFAEKFGRIIIVTNQQGVGKGLMTLQDVDKVHDFMVKEIEKQKGRVDKIYVCPQLKSDPDNFRKPSPRMAYMAQHDFPEIDFDKSVMIGDSNSDIEFGKNAGMYTILIGDEPVKCKPDSQFESLIKFAKILK
ncbi:MAG: HAD-IIIA family hydrolase [Bacteroidales bacterium]|nr:HAD-IIIA family hydrolase [Bacteroidales bacterium]MBO7529833.1 HAD-IIIA family hydrolase [Bacteroidales bacterium]MBQ3845338.1 HAD-IIIA family hydrolase [Bacteroidales bacterium]